MNKFNPKIKTNHVRVFDLEGLRKSISKFDLGVSEHKSFPGLFSVYPKNEPTAQKLMHLDIEKQIMPYVQEGEVFAVQIAATDNSSDIFAQSSAYMRTGNEVKIVRFDLDSIYQMAADEFDVYPSDISTCVLVENKNEPVRQELADGTIEYRLDGKLHNINNQPAIEYTSETKEWWANGLLHRENGPAIEYVSGDKYWYQYDHLHRIDGPAIEYADGGKAWYQHGHLHRLDGPAIEYADGGKVWLQHGRLHREDGPATELANGTQGWFLNDDHLSKEQFDFVIAEKNADVETERPRSTRMR